MPHRRPHHPATLLKRATCLGAILGVSFGALFEASAQGYPNRPIRIVVPYLPGGAADAVPRLVAQKLGEAFNQSVVMENKAGANTNIGAEFVAKSRPDGYTLLAASPAMALNVSLYQKIPYDVLKDFSPIILTGTSANVLIVETSFPAKTLKELIAAAKAKPGALTFGSGGNASSAHLSGELMKHMAQVDMVHVAYKGGAPVVTDLLGGRISMYFSSLPQGLPLIKAGKVRALAVTSEKRGLSAPDIPTMSEAGLPGYSVTAWHGFLTPAGTPQDIIVRLNAEIARLALETELKGRLEAQGIDLVAGSPAQFGAFLKAEIDKYATLVKVADIKAD